jgi:hypothetical protein
MTIDERLEVFTQTMVVLATTHRENQAAMTRFVLGMDDSIARLARVAERLRDLEERQ